VSVLAGAVATLFKMRENENSKAIARLEEKVAATETKAEKCERDRFELFAACEVNKFEIATLKKRIETINVDGTQYSHDMDNQKHRKDA
jgi:hypothetical protein